MRSATSWRFTQARIVAYYRFLCFADCASLYKLIIDVSGQHVGPIFSGLAVEDGTAKLSLNVSVGNTIL